MSSENKITGECFCGEIKYSLDGPLAPARSCHCSRCRKAFSGNGSTMTFVKENNFQWVQGEEKITLLTNKEGVALGFCSLCGTTLAASLKGEVFGITLGPLNDDPEVRVEEHIFVGSKACWDEIGGDAPQYQEFK